MFTPIILDWSRMFWLVKQSRSLNVQWLVNQLLILHPTKEQHEWTPCSLFWIGNCTLSVYTTGLGNMVCKTSAMQKSQARAGTNFTKPRTSFISGLCIQYVLSWQQITVGRTLLASSACTPVRISVTVTVKCEQKGLLMQIPNSRSGLIFDRFG